MSSIYGDNRKVKIEQETKCDLCIHIKVCHHKMEKLCKNFELGISPADGCSACINHFTRYCSENIPCFLCHEFDEKNLYRRR